MEITVKRRRAEMKKVKVVSLSEIVPGLLNYVPGMEKNGDLARLRRFVAGRGTVPVNVFGFTMTTSGRSLRIFHSSDPESSMFVLEKFVGYPEEARLSPGFQELFPQK